MARVALITGAGGGIGQAIAESLASRGVGVIALDIDQSSCRSVVEQIKSNGGVAYEAVADVTSDQDIKTVRAGLGAVAADVETVINCAGILKYTPFQEIGAAEWRLMIDTHVKGAFLVCKNFVPGMIQKGGGLIINTASEWAIVGSPGRAHYCAAKRAIHALTKCLALELAPHGIRAISIGPGPTDTPMLRDGLSESDFQVKSEKIARRIPLGRVGRPADVANLVSWLALGGGKFIDGQLLHVNGGSVMY
ncbi:MAG: SDR family NAD(P)-dependent oxidoreductase [Dehalococcoidia bacterium]|nr:SDR family NAD(P)-dependent oxidoreductase [Dehalococcoidia bacterium]